MGLAQFIHLGTVLIYCHIPRWEGSEPMGKTCSSVFSLSESGYIQVVELHDHH